MRLKVGPGTEIGSLAGEFSTWLNVECVYEISGDADLVAVVHVDDTVALRNLLIKCGSLRVKTRSVPLKLSWFSSSTSLTTSSI
ncbi:MAG: hypothetical protein Ct9H300mP10_10510 [Methanobacteriota archaeon]|nr:MAG: hypothetical protein Ct9H300mP10_10510 [Euryarchaeota archaeon]